MTPLSAPIAKKAARPMSSADLQPSERRFLATLDKLRFDRIESLLVNRGELILDPWPTTVHLLKFGATEADTYDRSAEFGLRKPIVEFFTFVRSLGEAKILRLDVRHGLPFSMEVEYCPKASGGRQHA